MKFPMWRRKRVELDDEIESHMQMAIRDRVERGETAARAEESARRELGNRGMIREVTRDAWGWRWFEDLLQDVRYGARMLRKNPVVSIIAIVTLALGIGANTAIFSVVNSVLLKPLPYPNPDRLVMLFLQPAHGDTGHTAQGTSDFLALRAGQRSFEHIAAVTEVGDGFTLTGHGTPEQIPGLAVTADFFATLSVKPFLGETYHSEDDQPGHKLSVVVSHRFWREHLHSDPSSIGKDLALNGNSYTVIGVMPPDFHFSRQDAEDLWVILPLSPINRRPPYFLETIGRLKPGVTQAQATADAAEISRQVQQQFPASPYSSASIEPFQSVLVHDAQAALWILLGAVGLVLLIAVVNVANLQLARAAAREREMAVRSALGASRGRLAVQLLTENILLAAIGGALGLFLAYWAVSALIAFAPGGVPRLKETTVDGHVLAFTAVIALLSGVIFGMVPAMRARPLRLSEFLKEGERGGQSSRHRFLHDSLVVVEFSLALVLLVGSGLLVRSLSRLQAVNPGFNPEHIVTMAISLPPQHYPHSSDVTSFYKQMLQKIENTPGVESAAISMSLPPNLLEVGNPFRLPGETIVPNKAPHLADEIPISSNYFQTLGVRLLRGRTFEDADHDSANGVLIINQTIAQQYFPGQDPVGKQIITGDSGPDAKGETIVGVVGNVKYDGLDTPDAPELYVPYFEEGWSPYFVWRMYVVVRTASDSQQIVPAVRSDIWSIDKDLPVTRVQTMDQLLTASVAGNQFRAVLFAIFAGLALVLAGIGIYGVLAYAVSVRTHEIGIRMALGAERKDVLRLVLWQGIRLAIAGVGLGIVAALGLTQLMASLLFGVSAKDPATFASVAILLTGVALLACYLPARRAMRVDPMVALRYE
jgi:predicted permease